ncbi:MAG TPA: hypothetical protein VI037_01770 [Nitrososphaera sp.]
MMMVEASKRIIAANSQGEVLGGGMKPPIKRNLEIQINLQNVSIDDQTRYDDLNNAKKMKE